MGMDAYLYRVRNIKQLQQEGFYDKCIDMQEKEDWYDDEFNSPAELWYARKFYGLNEEIFPDYECGDFIEVSKEKLWEMIIFATTHMDYWNNFNSVPALCRAYYNYDSACDKGWIYVYECDW